QLVRGLLDVMVDDRHIELRLRGELLERVLQPVPDGLWIVRTPPDQAPLKLLPARRSEEDQSRLWHRLSHLPGTLQIDLEQHGHALREVFLHGSPWRAVKVAGELGPLQELSGLDEPLELFAAGEVVVHALDLVWSAGAGRHGNREPNPRRARPDALDHAVLANPGGAGQDGESRAFRACRV